MKCKCGEYYKRKSEHLGICPHCGRNNKPTIYNNKIKKMKGSDTDNWNRICQNCGYVGMYCKCKKFKK